MIASHAYNKYAGIILAFGYSMSGPKMQVHTKFDWDDNPQGSYYIETNQIQQLH